MRSNADADTARISVAPDSPDRSAAVNDAVQATGSEWIEFDGVRVRRADFLSVGGLNEGVIGGAAQDLCLRLHELGREAEMPRLPGGPALVWLRRRHPGLSRTPRWWLGLLGDNRLRSRRRPPAPAQPTHSVVVLTDAYPARSETFVRSEVAALARLGWQVRVESSSRPARGEPAARRETRIDYLEDDPPLRTALDLARLVFRHPVRVLRDSRERRRWAAEEPDVWSLRSLASAARRLRVGGEQHLHVHFAAGAALHGLRLARILGLGYSVVGHGYDVFARPRNLAEKLSSAEFVVGPCAYTAAHLRAIAPGARTHVIVMGVDADVFERRAPGPNGRCVVAIGRLVEKKGFGHLIDAAAILERDAPLDRLVIAGDGPLREELLGAIAAAGLGDRAEIVEAWGSENVRGLLEGADLLAMPSVIAADGDREAMPVVVKEALAMEVPVVASDQAGLPELVERGWGRLVPPADSPALAAAIGELLALPSGERRLMGRRGREHVVARCNIAAETAKLAELISASLARRGVGGSHAVA